MGEMPTARQYVTVHRVDVGLSSLRPLEGTGSGSDCRGRAGGFAAGPIAAALLRVWPDRASDQSQRQVLRAGRQSMSRALAALMCDIAASRRKDS
jgi:hypothetical protein